ncbi:MAG: hypothetical protein Q3966_05845 [Neisseria sp.]|nr:hypothetical protein [Neisseria sp.]
MSLPRYTLLCLIAALCACEGRPSGGEVSPPPSASAQPAASSASVSAPTAWEAAGEFRAPNGFRYLYVVIPRPESREGLVAAARAIHEREPDAWLFLLDDGEKVPQALSANRSGDMSAFPAEWMGRHLLGSTAVAAMPDGRRQWVVYEGQSRGEPIAELPCIGGGGACRD